MLAWTQDTRVGTPVGFGAQVAVTLPPGVPTTYVLRALDTFGQTDEDTTSAEVVDTTAPTLSVAATPAVLWPANHKLVTVQVAITTSDACDASPTVRRVSISSNEGQLANGSGQTSPDIDGAEFGTDDREVLLRAERSGTGTGRTYTLLYEVEDASGQRHAAEHDGDRAAQPVLRREGRPASAGTSGGCGHGRASGAATRGTGRRRCVGARWRGRPVRVSTRRWSGVPRGAVPAGRGRPAASVC